MQPLIDEARTFPARAAAHGVNLGPHTTSATPQAMFIACSDAHVVPALITGSRPGDLYELRTYGGRISPYTEYEPTSEAQTIEHAVDVLCVTDIIVCGHSRCGVIDALHPDSEAAPFHLAAGHWHTLMQFDALSAYPCVQARLIDRTLRLHAWFYDIDAGTTARYDPHASTFLPL
ncbi:carbonic anhydrase [Streptomyces sp. SID14515]|uniref:carbonic anhydrase n=1 Tax=Streptomyces sp. SID14515 TaxID=2706074 RepID=UPI0013C9C9D7|nr:carbonic anhydrase [Streptomyces sp. SID14515]NEB39981.1 carbonic anhydrase [Streptomyces sp. SID14515]